MFEYWCCATSSVMPAIDYWKCTCSHSLLFRVYFVFFSHFVFVLSASCFGFWWWTSTVARIFISTIYPYTRTVSIAFFLYMYCERHTHMHMRDSNEDWHAARVHQSSGVSGPKYVVVGHTAHCCCVAMVASCGYDTGFGGRLIMMKMRWKHRELIHAHTDSGGMNCIALLYSNCVSVLVLVDLWILRCGHNTQTHTVLVLTETRVLNELDFFFARFRFCVHFCPPSTQTRETQLQLQRQDQQTPPTCFSFSHAHEPAVTVFRG